MASLKIPKLYAAFNGKSTVNGCKWWIFKLASCLITGGFFASFQRIFEELSACKTITHFFPIQSWTLWKITTGNFHILLWTFFTWICCYNPLDARILAAGSQIGPDPAAIHHQAPLQSCPIPTGLPDGVGECWGVGEFMQRKIGAQIYIYIYYTYSLHNIWVKKSGPWDPIFWSFFRPAVFVLDIW